MSDQSRKSPRLHDPLEDIRQQQETLTIGIRQHEKNPEIQNALRLQKDQLGKFANALKTEREQTKKLRDGGRAYTARLHEAGNLGNVLQMKDPNVGARTYTVHAFHEQLTKMPKDA